MSEREIADVLRAVPTVCGNLHHPIACRESGCVETGEPDYDAMARVVVERLMELGWVNLADAAVCHGGHAACVHVVEDMKARDARLARLGEALREAGDRLHGLSADPECMAHVFADCPRYTCLEVRAALADAQRKNTG